MLAPAIERRREKLHPDHLYLPTHQLILIVNPTQHPPHTVGTTFSKTHAFRLFSIELHLVFSPNPTPTPLDTCHLGQTKNGISDLLLKFNATDSIYTQFRK